MATFPDLVWFVLAIVAGAAVLGMLHSFAVQARNQVALHDLKLQVRRLQDEYTRRLAELTGPKVVDDAEVVEVDVLDDEGEVEPAEPEEAAAATAGRVGPAAEDQPEAAAAA